MISDSQVAYAKVTQAAAVHLKGGDRGAFYGYHVISSTAGTVTVTDGVGGTTIYSKTGLTTGDEVDFGGIGINCGQGVHVTVGGTAELTILYT